MSKTLWVVFFFVVLISKINAQTYSLPDAIEKALITDPRITEVEAYVRHAEALLSEAEGNASTFVTSNSFLGVSPALQGGLFGVEPCGSSGVCESRDDRFSLTDGVSPWFYVEFSVIKPLNSFGKIENYSNAAKHNIKIKEQDARLQRGMTIFDVKKAYYGHLTAKNSRLFLGDVKKRIDNAKDDVELWLDEGEGKATQSDLYALQSASALAQSYLLRAEALEKIAIDGLKVLTGLKLTDELSLADKRLNPVDLPEKDLLALQQSAMSERPEIIQLNHGLEARRALVKAKQSMKKPNVYTGLIGVFSYSPLRDRIDNPHITDPFNDFGVTPIIGMKWDWAGDVQSAQVKQTKAELDALMQKGVFAQKGIPYQVSENYQQAKALYDAVIELRKSAKAARKWMVSSYSDFQAGIEEVGKLVTAFTAYVTTYTDYLALVYEYNMQVAQLDQVIGAYQ